MPGVLISWFSQNNDFVRPRDDESHTIRFNPDGPHGQLYKSRFFHDGGANPCTCHVLAYQPSDSERVLKTLVPGLKKLLRADERQGFLIPVEQRAVSDPEDDLDIQKVIYTLYGAAVAAFEDRYSIQPDVHVFVSPGFPVMQTAWTILASAGSVRAALWRQTPGIHAQGKPLDQLLRRIPTTPMPEIGPRPQLRKTVLKFTVSEPDREKLEDVVESTQPLLLLGPPGIGKTTLARQIHEMSGRSGRFVRHALQGLNTELIVSGLVGHKKGAFTGAHEDRAGALHEADGGTLFLDEIHLAPAGVQNALLGLLSEPGSRTRFSRLGSNADELTDVRYVFACNQDMDQLVRRGQFRDDLLQRLRTGSAIRMQPIDLAGLSPGDCLGLLRDIWDHTRAGCGGSACPRFTPAAIESLQRSGFTTPRDLHTLCRHMMDSKRLRSAQSIDAPEMQKMIDRVERPRPPAAEEADAPQVAAAPVHTDPWASALHGLLSISDRHELLVRIQRDFSAITPSFLAGLGKRLKQPQFAPVRRHFAALEVPISAKRLGDHLKQAGLRD